MSNTSQVMAILARESERDFAQQIAASLNQTDIEIFVGTPHDATKLLAARSDSPRYLLIMVGDRASDVLPEIDEVAEYCEVGTHVVVLGTTNDVGFYRALRARGVTEYFTMPAKLADVKAALLTEGEEEKIDAGSSKVMAFMSAASGDGASTVALNTAYTLASEYGKSVVLVDMDYQFGMIAKNLDLTTPFGIKELFDHPDRGIDKTLTERMTVTYGNSRLKLIAAPNPLLYIPEVRAEVIRDMIGILKENYDVVVLDLPHLWTPWVAAAATRANHFIMVTQLWLRSATHSARLLGALRNVGVNNNAISLVVNRSGAKFKEAVSARDFERICALPIRYYFVNDIKSTVAAENQGKTLLEGPNSTLSRQFKEFAGFYGKQTAADSSGESPTSPVKSGRMGLLGR